MTLRKHQEPEQERVREEHRKTLKPKNNSRLMWRWLSEKKQLPPYICAVI